jgi:hypothetical protein
VESVLNRLNYLFNQSSGYNNQYLGNCSASPKAPAFGALPPASMQPYSAPVNCLGLFVIIPSQYNQETGFKLRDIASVIFG